MSTSESLADFDSWIREEFANTGEFTVLVVLVEIGETAVTPVCSTYFNVIGDEIDWSEMTVLFTGAGMDWNGAAFFPATDPDGDPLDNSAARVKLRDLEQRVDQNRLILNEGHFFDKWGRRLKIEQIVTR